MPPSEGGRMAEVFEDATVALPLMVAALFERLGYFSGKDKKKAKGA